MQRCFSIVLTVLAFMALDPTHAEARKPIPCVASTGSPELRAEVRQGASTVCHELSRQGVRAGGLTDPGPGLEVFFRVSITQEGDEEWLLSLSLESGSEDPVLVQVRYRTGQWTRAAKQAAGQMRASLEGPRPDLIAPAVNSTSEPFTLVDTVLA